MSDRRRNLPSLPEVIFNLFVLLTLVLAVERASQTIADAIKAHP